MSDVEIVDCGGVPEFYVDGFGAYRMLNGVLRCVGFAFQQPQFEGADMVAISVVKLVVSIEGANDAQMETQRVLQERPAAAFQIWRGARTGH